MTTNILIVEDESDFADLAGSLLDFHGWKVTVLGDSTKIADTIVNGHFDVIVTDIMMPGKNGFEVIETVRAHERFKNVPMMALSAKILNDAERKFLLSHHVEFMAKPFDPLALVEKLKLMVGKK